MAFIYKVLGQINPSANTNTTLYTVPANTSTVVSTITICNQLSTTANFRIAVRPGDETITSKHYINYDTPVLGNEQIALTIGISLATTDVVTVYANTANVSFNIFGSEIA
jgi:hypothetical protein